jgi:FtsH-binding integral membrane protein
MFHTHLVRFAQRSGVIRRATKLTTNVPVSYLQQRNSSSNPNDFIDNLNISIKPVSEEVYKKYTIDRYTKDVFNMTSMNILKIGGVTAAAVTITPFLSSFVNEIALVGGSLVGGTGIAIYSLYKISKETPLFEPVNAGRQNSEYHVKYSSNAWLYLNTFLFAEALVISPVVYMCYEMVPSALAITGGLMVAPVVTAYMLPKNSMLPLGSALVTGLCGLLCVSVAGMFIPSVGELVYTYEPWVGIGLFSLFNAYDTQVMLNSYEERKLDPMAHSINYTLNFLNIFIRVLEILAKSKQQNNRY